MAFDFDRKKLFVKTLEWVINKYEAAQTDAERQKAMVDALLIRDKFNEEDYPEISTSTEQRTAMVTLVREFNTFLAAMGLNQFSKAFKALKAVHNLIESFQA